MPVCQTKSANALGLTSFSTKDIGLFSEEQKISLLTEYFERLYKDISIKMDPYIQEIELCALELLQAEPLYQKSIIATIENAFQKTGNDVELVILKTK